MDELTFVTAERTGDATRSARSYLDFAINRRPLSRMIDTGDRVTVFGWLDRSVEKAYARTLLTRTQSGLASRHALLYICPECADPGCGAISVSVTVRDDCVVWSELGWDDVHTTRSPYRPEPMKRLFPELRDFWFDRHAYEAALARFA